MIRWGHLFEAGDIAWLLFVCSLAPVLVCGGLWRFMCQIENDSSKSRFVQEFPLHLSVTLLAWFGVIYSLAFAPSLGTHPVDSQEPAPMFNTMQEMMAVEDAKPDLTNTFGRGGFIGGLDYVGLNHLSPQAGTGKAEYPTRRPQHHLPHVVSCLIRLAGFGMASFMLLMTWASQASGIRLALRGVLWAVVVYAPVAHSVLGDGWLEQRGAVDFAGATVWMAVGCSLWWCRRQEATLQPEPSPDSWALLGVWLGLLLMISAGAFHAGGQTAMALTNGLLGVASSLLAWSFCNSFLWCQPHASRLFPGMLSAGVAMCACGGFILPQAALMVGAATGVIANLLDRVFQGASSPQRSLACACWSGGACGLLGTALFATSSVAGHRWDGRELAGLLQGQSGLLIEQVFAIAAITGWSLGTNGLLQGFDRIWTARSFESAPHITA